MGITKKKEMTQRVDKSCGLYNWCLITFTYAFIRISNIRFLQIDPDLTGKIVRASFAPEKKKLI